MSKVYLTVDEYNKKFESNLIMADPTSNDIDGFIGEILNEIQKNSKLAAINDKAIIKALKMVKENVKYYFMDDVSGTWGAFRGLLAGDDINFKGVNHTCFLHKIPVVYCNFDANVVDKKGNPIFYVRKYKDKKKGDKKTKNITYSDTYVMCFDSILGEYNFYKKYNQITTGETCSRFSFVLDCDTPYNLEDFKNTIYRVCKENNFPEPTYITNNPKSNHNQVGWVLQWSEAVFKKKKELPWPPEFIAGYMKINKIFGNYADTNFKRYIIKNPYNENYKSIINEKNIYKLNDIISFTEIDSYIEESERYKRDCIRRYREEERRLKAQNKNSIPAWQLDEKSRNHYILRRSLYIMMQIPWQDRVGENSEELKAWYINYIKTTVREEASEVTGKGLYPMKETISLIECSLRKLWNAKMDNFGNSILGYSNSYNKSKKSKEEEEEDKRIKAQIGKNVTKLRKYERISQAYTLRNQGKSDEEIAQELDIALKTVKEYFKIKDIFNTLLEIKKELLTIFNPNSKSEYVQMIFCLLNSLLEFFMIKVVNDEEYTADDCMNDVANSLNMIFKMFVFKTLIKV